MHVQLLCVIWKNFSTWQPVAISGSLPFTWFSFDIVNHCGPVQNSTKSNTSDKQENSFLYPWTNLFSNTNHMLGLSGTSSYAVLVYFVFVYLYFLYLTHRNIIFNILEQFSKKNHMLGLSGTSSYAVFVYLYFLYLRADVMQNHICWHLFACSPLCVIKCTLKLPTWANANSHWLHLSDFWDCLPGQLYIHNYCTCLLFLHYEFLNVSSDFLLEQMQNHNGCICLTFLHCLLTNVFYQQLGGCIYVALYISIVCIMPTIGG